MPVHSPVPARRSHTLRRSTRRPARLALATGLAAAALGAHSTLAGAATAVSSNWSGYAVTGTTFRSVSGSWVQPAASCTSSTATTTASAFWVGLGGDSSSSKALEQTGTEADCLADGTVRYSAWYELVPASSVRVRLAVAAGDRIAGSVKASGRSVTVELRDLTTGTSFRKTLTMATPDTSSAEWIAEAPGHVDPRRRDDPAPDRLRHRAVHERDRDRERRPRGNDRRSRLDGDPDRSPLEAAAAAAPAPSGRLPPTRQRARRRSRPSCSPAAPPSR